MAQQIVRPHELRLDTPKAAIYARVSTLNGQNPDVQTREIKEYCRRRGFEIFSVYVDRGVSGKKASRPQLNRMMEDARQRRFDVVWLWSPDLIDWRGRYRTCCERWKPLMHWEFNSCRWQNGLIPVHLQGK